MIERCDQGRLMRYTPFPDDPGFAMDIGQCPLCDGDPLGCVDELEMTEGDMFPEGAPCAS